MEREARMSAEPYFHLGVLVTAAIVEDHVDHLAGRGLGLDGVQKPNELLVPVALHTAADHLAFEHVEGGEQCGRAVPLVVVSHGSAPARLHRQARLGAVERLDLALFIYAGTIAWAGGST
jgi:hypothetical protein